MPSNKELADLIKEASKIVREQSEKAGKSYIDVSELRKLAKGGNDARKPEEINSADQ